MRENSHNNTEKIRNKKDFTEKEKIAIANEYATKQHSMSKIAFDHKTNKEIISKMITEVIKTVSYNYPLDMAIKIAIKACHNAHVKDSHYQIQENDDTFIKYNSLLQQRYGVNLKLILKEAIKEECIFSNSYAYSSEEIVYDHSHDSLEELEQQYQFYRDLLNSGEIDEFDEGYIPLCQKIESLTAQLRLAEQIAM